MARVKEIVIKQHDNTFYHCVKGKWFMCILRPGSSSILSIAKNHIPKEVLEKVKEYSNANS